MMTMLQSPSLTPRDINNIAFLKELGLSLVEVKISQVSFAKGQLLNNIPLPENARVVCIVRHGKAIVELEAVFLEEQDSIYLITDDEYQVRQAFTI
jgi:NhaP-type Na+/H+ and K+/H+ antiporter